MFKSRRENISEKIWQIYKNLWTKIARLKSLLNREGKIVFTGFFILATYLIFNTDTKFVWIIFSSFFFLALLINDPKYLLVGLLLVIVALLIRNLYISKHLFRNVDDDYKVISVTGMGPIIKVDGTRVLVKTYNKYFDNDVIHVQGQISTVINTRDFDVVTYLKTRHVENIIVHSKILLVKESLGYRNLFQKFLFDGGSHYRKVAPLLVLGEKTKETKEIYKMAFKMSIIHLFVISGFHISLFFMIINKIFTLCKIKESYASIFALLPIILYLFFLNFPISATRAMLLVIGSVINKIFLKKYFSSMEILSFVMIIMFLWNPYAIFSLSFIFTFIATYVVIYLNGCKFKKEWHKYLAIAVGAYMSNVVISMYTNQWLSIFGIIFGAILSPVFVIIYTLSIFLFPFKTLMDYIYMIFIFILQSINQINIVIDIPHINLYIIQLIYLLPFTFIIIKRIWNWYMAKKVT